MTERIIPVDLGGDIVLAVVAEQRGPQLVADKDITARLTAVTKSIEVVAREALDAVRRVAPDAATVELSFSLAVEEGQLVALLGRGKAEASISVTLEWSKDEDK
jgi:hypothetical protein